jgi:DNA-binding transcriptional LysR family regulator
MGVHTRDLRYFLAVVDELNFTRAAEKVFVSQPALSKQIRLLEAQLGTALFVRDTRSVSLTPTGEALVPYARTLVGTWAEAEASVRATAASQRRVITVGLLTSIGRDIAEIRTAFNERRDDWQLSMRVINWGDTTGGLGDRSSDVAFLWLPLFDPTGMAWEVLYREPISVALPVDHRLAGRERIAFDELLDEQFLALPTGAGPARSFWLAESSRGGRPIRVSQEVSGADETFEAVAMHTGIALLAAGNASIYRRDSVTCIPVDGVPSAELAIVWRSDDKRTVVSDFVHSCLDTVAEPLLATES